RLAGVRQVVVAVRGLGLGLGSNDGAAARAVHAFAFSLYKRSFAVADVAWFTNASDAEYFRSRGACPNDKVLITRNGVDRTFWSMEAVAPGAPERIRAELGVPPSGRCVVMVARLTVTKGVREFIDAATMLRTELPDIRFVLVAPEEK